MVVKKKKAIVLSITSMPIGVNTCLLNEMYLSRIKKEGVGEPVCK